MLHRFFMKIRVLLNIIKLKFFYTKCIKIGKRLNFGHNFFVMILKKKSRVTFGNRVTFRNNCNIIVDGGILIIKDRVFFNNNCSINVLGQVEISENTLFGENVKIYDHNHIHKKTDDLINSGFNVGKVKIGKNCWIGSNVTILNNVEIGDNVVIGANCLIYKSIETNKIVKQKSEYIIEDRK